MRERSRGAITQQFVVGAVAGYESAILEKAKVGLTGIVAELLTTQLRVESGGTEPRQRIADHPALRQADHGARNWLRADQRVRRDAHRGREKTVWRAAPPDWPFKRGNGLAFQPGAIRRDAVHPEVAPIGYEQRVTRSHQDSGQFVVFARPRTAPSHGALVHSVRRKEPEFACRPVAHYNAAIGQYR